LKFFKAKTLFQNDYKIENLTNLAAEKRDDVSNFVKKIRSKNIWNILFIL